MNKALLALALGGLFLPQQSFAQTEEIVEGESVGGVLFLGMSRAEIVDISGNNNCSTSSNCSFSLGTPSQPASTNPSPREPRTQVFFDGNIVTKIVVFSGDFAGSFGAPGFPRVEGFTTTGGANFLSFPRTVADIYGVRARRLGRRTTLRNQFIVEVPAEGYTFVTNLICFRATCSTRESRHEIYFPE